MLTTPRKSPHVTEGVLPLSGGARGSGQESHKQRPHDQGGCSLRRARWRISWAQYVPDYGAVQWKRDNHRLVGVTDAFEQLIRTLFA